MRETGCRKETIDGKERWGVSDGVYGEEDRAWSQTCRVSKVLRQASVTMLKISIVPVLHKAGRKQQ